MRLKDFMKAGNPATLLMSFLYFDMSFMVWVLIGVLGVHISESFNLSAAEKGLLVAIPILGGSLVRVPLGLLGDKFGPKRAGMVAQLVVMFPLAYAWLSGQSFNEVLVLGIILGVAGGSFAIALPLASRWYPPEHQGLAMGIAGAGNSGTVLSALFAPRIAEAVGWHNVFGFALIPMGVTFILFSIFTKDRHTISTVKPLAHYLAVARQADIGWFSILYSFTFGGFVGLASFLVIFFHDQYELTKIMAGNLTAICVFSGSFLRPVGGLLADHFGGIRVLTSLLICVVFGLTAIASLPSLPIILVLMFLTMGCLGMSNGSVFQIVPQRFGNEIGIATGLVGAAGGLGGFLLPMILGSAKQAFGSYTVGFACIAAFGIGCLTLLRIVRVAWLKSWLAGDLQRSSV